MWSTVGSCPKCGAPIYAPAVWGGVTPPPNTYTCACNPQATGQTYTATNFTMNPFTREAVINAALAALEEN